MIMYIAIYLIIHTIHTYYSLIVIIQLYIVYFNNYIYSYAFIYTHTSFYIVTSYVYIYSVSISIVYIYT